MTAGSEMRDEMFGGIPIRCASANAAVQSLLVNAADSEGKLAYRLVNSYTLSLARRDPSYGALLRAGGVNFSDGRPLALVLTWLTGGNAKVDQVRGPTLFSQALDEGRRYGIRHFFLGANEDVLDRMRATVESRYPGAEIAGSWAPPFRPITSQEREFQDVCIRRASPDVVWVGLGTPKQDFEAQRIRDELDVTTAGVGAAFDFLAGSKAEAPPWLRWLGLEWLFRLVNEPRRLWKRYLVGNAVFLSLAGRELINRGWSNARSGRT